MIDYTNHAGWFGGSPDGAHNLDGDSGQDTTFTAYHSAVGRSTMNI
jgi:hypothetical protein